MDLFFFYKEFTGLFYDTEFVNILIQRDTQSLINYIRKNAENLDRLDHDYDDKFFGITISALSGMNKKLDFSSSRVLYLSNKNVDLLFSLFYYSCINLDKNTIDCSTINELDESMKNWFSKILNVEEIVEINFLFSEQEENFVPTQNPANFHSFLLVLIYLCESIFSNLQTVKVGIDTRILQQEVFFADLHAHYLTIFFFIYTSNKNLNLSLNFTGLSYDLVQNYSYNTIFMKDIHKYLKQEHFPIDYINLFNSALFLRNYGMINLETNDNIDMVMNSLKIIENSVGERELKIKGLSIKTCSELFSNKAYIDKFFNYLCKIVSNKPLNIELDFQGKDNKSTMNQQCFSIGIRDLFGKIVEKGSANIKFMIKIPDCECLIFDKSPLNSSFRFKKFSLISKLYNPNLFFNIKFFSINSKSLKLHVLDENVFKKINPELRKLINSNRGLRSLDLKVKDNGIESGKYLLQKSDLSELLKSLEQSQIEKFKMIVISNISLDDSDLKEYQMIFGKSKLKKFSMILEKNEDSLAKSKKRFMMNRNYYFYKEEERNGNLCTFFIQNTEEFK